MDRRSILKPTGAALGGTVAAGCATGGGAPAGAGMGAGAAGTGTGTAPMPFTVTSVTLPIVGSAEVFPVRRIDCIGDDNPANVREMGSEALSALPVRVV